MVNDVLRVGTHWTLLASRPFARRKPSTVVWLVDPSSDTPILAVVSSSTRVSRLLATIAPGELKLPPTTILSLAPLAAELASVFQFTEAKWALPAEIAAIEFGLPPDCCSARLSPCFSMNFPFRAE